MDDLNWSKPSTCVLFDWIKAQEGLQRDVKAKDRDPRLSEGSSVTTKARRRPKSQPLEQRDHTGQQAHRALLRKLQKQQADGVVQGSDG